jgi:MFS transporter, ACS family, hexuronate transporter
LKKRRGLRWWIIALIGIATIINYIDRTSLQIMWPDISGDLGFGADEAKSKLALIITFFTISYAIGQALSGKFFDWIGTRMGFVITIGVWSVACALHGLARSVASFSLFRSLLGISEAGNWPGATKSNAEWFPIKERALAQGIFNAGASIGAVISAPLIALLYIFVGWQATFFIIAGLGFIWIIPWIYFNRAEPAKHPHLSDEERNYILEGQKVSHVADPDKERVPGWGELLTYKQSWSVILSRFFLDNIWWLFVNWLPIYLFEKFNFSIKDIGMMAWIPYFGAAIGSIAGGWMSGYFLSKSWTVDKARKGAIIMGAFISVPALVITAFVNEPLLAVVLSAFTLFGFQFAMQNIQTMPSDFFSGKSVGSLAGMGGFSASAGVLITTWMVPYLTTGQNYFSFFMLGAIMFPLCIACIYIFAPKIERVKIKDKNNNDKNIHRDTHSLIEQ